MKPTRENIEELLDLACNEGGSGQGLSHYKSANACGMRAHLSLINTRAAGGSAYQRSVCNPDKVQSLRVGSAYHKFHEWWSEEALNGFDHTTFTDPSFTLAWELFQAYIAAHGKRAWGRVLHNEWTLPESEAARNKNVWTFSGELVNAKPDRVTLMDETTVREAEKERGVRLDGPGVYVIDFKTSGVDHDERYWQTSAQALWYPHAVKIERPDYDVKGMIFDIIRKPRKKSDSATFEAFYVPMRENAIEKLTPFIRQGAHNIFDARTKQVGNVTDCVRSNFGRDEVCPYYGAQCAFTRSA